MKKIYTFILTLSFFTLGFGQSYTLTLGSGDYGGNDNDLVTSYDGMTSSGPSSSSANSENFTFTVIDPVANNGNNGIFSDGQTLYLQIGWDQNPGGTWEFELNGPLSDESQLIALTCSTTSNTTTCSTSLNLLQIMQDMGVPDGTNVAGFNFAVANQFFNGNFTDDRNNYVGSQFVDLTDEIVDYSTLSTIDAKLGNTTSKIASNQLFVGESGDYNIQVYNINGQLVKSASENIDSNNGFDLNLSQGFYIIKLEKDGVQETIKAQIN